MIRIQGFEIFGLASSLSGGGDKIPWHERMIDGICAVVDGVVAVTSLGFIYSGLRLFYFARKLRK